MNDKPNYYAIIPAHVRYSDIPAAAKLLYGEMTALTSKEGFSWATNSYFAELYGVHTNSIVLWLGHLEEKGFIKTEVDKMAGNKRKIWLIADKFGTPLSQKIVIPITKNVASSINNTSNTISAGAQNVSEEIKEVPISEDGDSKSVVTKARKDVSYRQVFSLFGRYPRNWDLNKTQIQAAKNLLAEHKIEIIRGALKFHTEYKDEPFCPEIHSPYDLDSKWTKLVAFKRKHEQ